MIQVRIYGVLLGLDGTKYKKNKDINKCYLIMLVSMFSADMFLIFNMGHCTAQI